MQTFHAIIARFADSAASRLSAPVRRKRIWAIWSCCAAIVLCANCATLTLSPVIWQDEVQIVDFGRLSLPGADLTWGMQWSDADRPMQSPFVVGNVTQELAFRLFPGGIFGTRLAAQIGLILASGALMGWMLSNGLLPALCLLASVLLLVEPTLTQGVRGGRVDALAMMFVLLSCWAAAAVRSRRLSPVTFSRLGLAGLSLGMAGLAWPSSVLMVSLFSNQLFDRTTGGWRQTLRRCLSAFLRMGVVGIGAAATIVLAIAIRPDHGLQAIRDFQNGLHATASVSVAHGHVWIDSLRTMVACLEASPWLLVFPFYGIAVQRRWRLLAVVCLTIACVIASRAYFYRVIYIVPLLLVVSMTTAHAILTDYKQRRARPSGVILVAGFLVVSMGVSLVLLGVRTYIARTERSARNPDIIQSLAETAIGPGPSRVYVGPWEFYFPGRRLGWKMHRNRAADEPPDWGKMAGFLDYAILERSQVSGDIDSQLTNHGFVKKTVRPNIGRAAAGPLTDGKNYDREYIIYFRPVR